LLCASHRGSPRVSATGTGRSLGTWWRLFDLFVYCQEMTSSETLVPFR
jgi:hypothetical protein